ncbi:MAG: hydrogenase maturation protease [Desulfurococcales archaeon]|nr:hydrogenase maturation protease [Desulfurococcales archaeon]
MIKDLTDYDDVIGFLKDHLRRKPILILGVGNELRRDDGFGTYLARSLAGYVSKFMKLRNMYIIDAGNAPELYTDILRKARNGSILLIDAILVEGRKPGDIVAFDIDQEGIDDLQLIRFITTHTLDLRIMMKAAGVRSVLVLGVVPYSTNFGLGLTEPVARAFRILFRAFTRFLSGLTPTD